MDQLGGGAAEDEVADTGIAEGTHFE